MFEFYLKSDWANWYLFIWQFNQIIWKTESQNSVDLSDLRFPTLIL